MNLSGSDVAFAFVHISLEDPRGRQGCAPLPRVSKLFHFHAVFGKKLKNNSTFGSWRTPLGKILDPPLHIDEPLGDLKCTKFRKLKCKSKCKSWTTV